LALSSNPAFQFRCRTFLFTTKTLAARLFIQSEAVFVELAVAGSLEEGEPGAGWI
jgi:hypothetical protein